MTMFSKEDVLRAVLTARLQWRGLLGDDGAAAAESLVAVAQGGGDQARRAVNLLLDLFERHDAVDALREQIDMAELGGGERLYEGLAGRMGPVAAPGVTYRCPVAGCHVTWTPQMAGQRAPRCPEHDRILQPVP